MNLWGKSVLTLLTIAFLVGCAAPTAPSPTQTIQPATATITATTPTLTLTPSETRTPSPTSEAGLKTNGPYLVYLRGADVDHQQLVLMDADGLGRKTIVVPTENRLYTNFLSPDGKWLAYYTGSAKKEKASDLALHLLNIETGQTRLVSKLLSKDYPDNFVGGLEELKGDDRLGMTADRLKDVFISGITRSIGWSPDGQYLAFAGQMDGLSSDIYLYDLAKGSFRRISKGPQEIQEIAWSPDGRWILSSSTTYFGEGGGYDEDAISFDNFTIKPLPYRNYGVERQWYNDHTYIIHNNGNGSGDFNLRLVNIETGVVRKIWGGAFYSFAFDPEQGLILIFAWTREWPEPNNSDFVPGGAYLVNIKTGKETNIYPDSVDGTSFFGLGNRRFFSSYNGEAHFITEDGKLTPADPTLNYTSVAPDKQHWVSIGKTLKVFNANDSLAADILLPFTPPSAPYDFRMLWAADSSGLFIIFGTEIYSVNIQHQEIHLVETQLLPFQDVNFTSIQEK